MHAELQRGFPWSLDWDEHSHWDAKPALKCRRERKCPSPLFQLLLWGMWSFWHQQRMSITHWEPNAVSHTLLRHGVSMPRPDFKMVQSDREAFETMWGGTTYFVNATWYWTTSYGKYVHLSTNGILFCHYDCVHSAICSRGTASWYNSCSRCQVTEPAPRCSHPHSFSHGGLDTMLPPFHQYVHWTVKHGLALCGLQVLCLERVPHMFS